MDQDIPPFQCMPSKAEAPLNFIPTWSICARGGMLLSRKRKRTKVSSSLPSRRPSRPLRIHRNASSCISSAGKQSFPLGGPILAGKNGCNYWAKNQIIYFKEGSEKKCGFATFVEEIRDDFDLQPLCANLIKAIDLQPFWRNSRKMLNRDLFGGIRSPREHFASKVFRGVFFVTNFETSARFARTHCRKKFNLFENSTKKF